MNFGEGHYSGPCRQRGPQGLGGHPRGRAPPPSRGRWWARATGGGLTRSPASSRGTHRLHQLSGADLRMLPAPRNLTPSPVTQKSAGHVSERSPSTRPLRASGSSGRYGFLVVSALPKNGHHPKSAGMQPRGSPGMQHALQAPPRHPAKLTVVTHLNHSSHHKESHSRGFAEGFPEMPFEQNAEPLAAAEWMREGRECRAHMKP